MPPLFFVQNRSERDLLSRTGKPFTGVEAVSNLLRQLELFDLLADVQDLSRVAFNPISSAGPSGSAGLLFSVGPLDGQPADPVFDPAAQEWQQVSSDVWIGSAAGVVPRPADLERHHCPVESFENVVLADGRVWEIPVIRQVFDEQQAAIVPADYQRSNLPNLFFRDVNRSWRMDVVPEYRALWEQSRRMFEALLEDQPLLYVDLMTFAAAVLGLRYRFNLLIHSRWPDQFVTTGNVISVVKAAIGWHVLERYSAELSEKKNQG